MAPHHEDMRAVQHDAFSQHPLSTASGMYADTSVCTSPSHAVLRYNVSACDVGDADADQQDHCNTVLCTFMSWTEHPTCLMHIVTRGNGAGSKG